MENRPNIICVFSDTAPEGLSPSDGFVVFKRYLSSDIFDYMPRLRTVSAAGRVQRSKLYDILAYNGYFVRLISGGNVPSVEPSEPFALFISADELSAELSAYASQKENTILLCLPRGENKLSIRMRSHILTPENLLSFCMIKFHGILAPRFCLMPLCAADITATVLSLCGIELSGTVGRDISPALLDGIDEYKSVYFKNRPYEGFITPRFIYTEGLAGEYLFDSCSGFDEKINLISDGLYKTAVERLRFEYKK